MDQTNGFGANDGLQSIGASLDGLNISAERVAKTLTGAFSKAVQSGQSFDKTLQSILMSLGKMALSAGMPLLQKGLTSLFSGLFGGGGGGGGSGGISATPFADGGIVAQPTFFGSNGGLGLMGERGAEAIMPLARGPDGRLGLATSGQAGGPVNVTVNITTADAESFRRSQVQISGALARAVARGQRGL